MSGLQYDVTIIGGGVTGAAVARELSRYQLKTCLVERAELRYFQGQQRHYPRRL